MSVITTGFSPMDSMTPSYLQSSTLLPAIGRHSLDSDSSSYFSNKGNPFADSFPDPLCKLNLKETSDFVKAFPMNTKCSGDNRGLLEASSQKRREGLSLMGQKRLETPSTPGKPVFSFSPGHLYRKNIPSKWDDAEKWLISSSCNESPAHVTKPTESSSKSSRQHGILPQKGFDGPVMSMDPIVPFSGASSEVLLKDKFTNNADQVCPNFRYSEQSEEDFVSKNSCFGPAMKDMMTAAGICEEVQRRDIGTEMTPLGSSTATRCNTPIKSSSPARHNTPADRSGALVPCNTCIDISELSDCHFAKLKLSAQYDPIVPNWSSREEEEVEVSRSLRHLEMSSGRTSIGVSWASAWEEEERTKSCLRYQKEEAKIQAWLNLQNAKAEAQSRKLEVKIQKMRSNLEEKLMKRMAIVHRRAEEWKAAAQQQHSQQLKRASEHAHKMKSQQSSRFPVNSTCGCFPCNNQL
ncbi:hypothetical protein OPV22_028190 [Ensete ventricosum]|uniref:Remorin C-terminal domain-containing protein n=1 Tax=Ensete ventricosum TaxID=4639 RepID=A0AAV8PXI7_ENSVE|nr:hypothetical protein OPV22_028190 [Ensete ventricosum]